jgi:hypothetical protein
VDGPVLVMMHPYYALLAGKEPGAHIASLWHARYRGRDPLPADLVAKIEEREYAAIVSDGSPFFESEPALLALIEAHYRPEPLPAAESPPTLTGLAVRPRTLYRRR